MGLFSLLKFVCPKIEKSPYWLYEGPSFVVTYRRNLFFSIESPKYPMFSTIILLQSFIPSCSFLSQTRPLPKEVYQMKYELMTQEELCEYTSGEAITLTAVMAILATAVIAVVVYRLFLSKKGSATVPGGWKFTWN